ncbi:MAG: hypothetical protein KDA36_07615 [Planctomycetaceae bacterium]|nr:hypothetical protein [Planctomycetaceae bacterium]
MTISNSVTRWCSDLRDGDPVAAERIWKRFSARIVAMARTKLGDAPRQMSDEEDIANSAFASLFSGIQGSRFPELLNRDSLWRLLVVITVRKVYDQLEYQHRQKRDVFRERDTAGGPEGDLLRWAISQEPTPEIAAQLTENVSVRLRTLPSDDLRQIALLKLEGYTNIEIAERLDRGLATIARKLSTIRAVWEETE